MLDATLIAGGEVTWCGLDPLGEHDGGVALSGMRPRRAPILSMPRPAAPRPATLH